MGVGAEGQMREYLAPCVACVNILHTLRQYILP